ncbi:hypothetical protein PV326_004668 [Microctonus aethiopoides]|nr:hypothetical protein PV326_004668 [Microctonus aethiopoides]
MSSISDCQSISFSKFQSKNKWIRCCQCKQCADVNCAGVCPKIKTYMMGKSVEPSEYLWNGEGVYVNRPNNLQDFAEKVTIEIQRITAEEIANVTREITN